MTTRSKIACQSCLGLFVATLLLTNVGCQSLKYWWDNDYRVGPNYAEPIAPVAGAYSESNKLDKSGVIRINSATLADPQWWKTFNDPFLDDLIENVFAQNLTLKQAAWRIEQARALRDIQSTNLLPQQTIGSGAYARNQNNSLGPPVSSNLWSTGFNSSWEIDFWGKIRRNIDASNADLCAAIKDYDYSMVTLAGDVATLYIQILALEERIGLAQQNVTALQGSLRIARDRMDAKVASPLDVAQAESNLYSTQALIPSLELSLRKSLNGLAVLLGIPPSHVSSLGPTGGKLPIIPAQVMVGIPAELVMRRPDIRSAERSMKSQFESIGIAESALYPTFSIVGNLGYQAPEIRDLFTTSGFTGGISPKFSWNILNFGRIKNQVRANEAQFNQLQYDFESRVLKAQEDVENSMFDFIKSHELYLISVENERANVEAARIVNVQFKAGNVDFGRVFVVQANLVQVQDQLVTNKANIALALINTYRSLGGGWEIKSNINGTN